MKNELFNQTKYNIVDNLYILPVFSYLKKVHDSVHCCIVIVKGLKGFISFAIVKKIWKQSDKSLVDRVTYSHA
jgi:hypothetical protein